MHLLSVFMCKTQSLLQWKIVMIFLCLSAKISAQNNKIYNCFINNQQYTLEQGKWTKDSFMFSILSKYKDSLNQHFEEVIVQSAIPLTKAQPESSLGNWVADAVKMQLGKKQKINACIINYGSIGLDYLAPGNIKRKDFYQLIPHENKMVLMQLNGKEIQQLCDSIATLGGIPVSGIVFAIKDNGAQNIFINQQKLNEHLIYTVAVNDYMLFNRKFMEIWGKQKAKPTHKNLRNILIENALELQQKGEKINTTLDNRISYAE